jgi:hypothetical protein
MSFSLSLPSATIKRAPAADSGATMTIRIYAEGGLRIRLPCHSACAIFGRKKGNAKTADATNQGCAAHGIFALTSDGDKACNLHCRSETFG